MLHLKRWYVNSIYDSKTGKIIKEGNTVNHSFVLDGQRYKFLGFEQPDGKITKERGEGIPMFQVAVKEKVNFT